MLSDIADESTGGRVVLAPDGGISKGDNGEGYVFVYVGGKRKVLVARLDETDTGWHLWRKNGVWGCVLLEATTMGDGYDGGTLLR